MRFSHNRSASGPSPSEGLLKPPRRRDKILGFFSRSRSPSPSPHRQQADNETAFAANQSLDHAPPMVPAANLAPARPRPRPSPVQPSPTTRPVTLKDTPLVTVTELGPNVDADTVDLPQSAYQKALASFSQEQREKLTREETLRSLFKQLNESDHDNLENSLLRRGLKRVKPHLERLNATIDFISPFTSMEPAAGTALGLVKGSASIAIAICGCFEDVTKEIAGFLERIPAIDRCAAVVGGVDVYKDLLQFYLDTVALFEESHFVLRVAFEILKPTIATVVSSFRAHMEVLSGRIETESFATIQEIKDEQVEALISRVLDRNAGYHESPGQTELQNRADDACRWLTSDDAFSYWLLSRDSNVLALFGDMGSGKTMTTAFVADSLATTERPLCAYYCRDEHELANLGNIYRSILLQFVKQSYAIKQRFSKWYKETGPILRGSPTKSDAKLRELLFDIISSSQQPVFVVVDALDECGPDPRNQLLRLFQELLQNKAPLKVFVSSRYSDVIEASLPPGFARVELRPSRDRDRAIVTHLVDRSDIPREFRQKVVDDLVPRACGSAIWLQIAVRYIGLTRTRKPKGLEMALAMLPSSEGLLELYGRLFSKTCNRIAQNETLLQLALDILAVARRPLTPDELAHAIFTLNPMGEDPATLADLDELAQSFDIVELVRPFTTVINGKDGKSLRLRLVHQSLKELVLTAPPSEWCFAQVIAKRKKGERAAELNANLLQRCIEYLLLDEFGEKSLFTSSDDASGAAAELFAIGGVLDDELDAHVLTGTATPKSTGSSDFGPSVLRFGGFYAYAAAHWTSHFSDVSPERRPDTQKLIRLCSKGSQRLENWVEQWRRPNGSYIPEFDFPEHMSALDPLVIAAMFGPAATVADLLKLKLDSSTLTKDSAWTAVWHLIERGDISLLKTLIQDEALRPILCCCKFLYTAISAVRWTHNAPQGIDDAATTRGWEEIFDFLIRHLRDDLVDCGNDMLRRAARSGCLVLIKRLFRAAENDAELRQAILRIDMVDDPLARRRGGGSSGFLGEHQSIGEAAYEGHADVVRFLCEQPGLESHLRYVNPATGDTVFHKAVRRPNEEVLRTLIRHWPEGINIPEKKGGDTPLIVLVFNHSRSVETRIVRLVRLLLHEGKADAKANENGSGFSALCTAVRGGFTGLLRVLVVEGGADVLQAVDIDGETGRPFLRKGVDTWQDAGEREEMLRVLCSLLPLAVSVDYLV